MQTTPDLDKSAVLASVRQNMEERGFHILSVDDQRPWGGFFVLDEAQVPLFVSTFFPHLSMEDFEGFSALSPKILMVAPEHRLSWQYHHRRAELWKVIGGSAGVVVSDSDDETELLELSVGDIISLRQGERHRLVGLDEWGIVAEIWQHTDSENPSNEQDIVRLQDDYRKI